MAFNSKIGEWTEQELSRFIARAIRTSPASLPPSMALEVIEATKRLEVAGELALSSRSLAYLRDHLHGPRPTVSGSRGGNAALASLLTKLASVNLINDATTA